MYNFERDSSSTNFPCETIFLFLSLSLFRRFYKENPVFRVTNPFFHLNLPLQIYIRVEKYLIFLVLYESSLRDNYFRLFLSLSLCFDDFIKKIQFLEYSQGTYDQAIFTKNEATRRGVTIPFRSSGRFQTAGGLMHCEIHNASRYELSKMCETNLPLCEAIIKLLRQLTVNSKYNNAIIFETRM